MQKDTQNFFVRYFGAFLKTTCFFQKFAMIWELATFSLCCGKHSVL